MYLMTTVSFMANNLSYQIIHRFYPSKNNEGHHPLFNER